MEENIKNTMTEDIENDIEENTSADKTNQDDALKTAVKEQLRKIQRQNLLIGAQTMCRVVLDKIIAAKRQPGKRTMNDYKRLVKDIENFCTIGISRKVNADGETEPISENEENNTKLMEESDEV